LLGPFIFIHSGFTLNSSANTILFSIVSCTMYGGIFPFVLIWMKSDKRLFDQCMAKQFKVNNFYILKEYEELQLTLNLPQHHLEQFMAANEKEIMLRLESTKKRLRMECASTVVGYFGAIYILTFMLKLNELDMVDSSLVFVMGYLAKDFIFAILFGIVASYIIARKRLYNIKMNSKFFQYALIMTLGIFQQCVATILCGLYPHVSLRMYIIYTSIGVNAVVCSVMLFEILRQKKNY